ncbi:MAG: type II toxin-antitoxin system VapC family toxin [Hyphomonadaceae bacterium]|nr:type II toxin-antitoxin system VapC family toxin [Hyphomonadaceae bacterium]
MLSELRREDRADANVRAWAARTKERLWISAVTVFELERGVLRVARRDPVQGAHLRRWLDHQIFPAFEQTTLALDFAAARRCARLHVPDPRSYRDAFIAATALVHRLTVVTRNVADFEPMGVSLLNPWTA